MWEPIRFLPVYKSYLWGGRVIPEHFGRSDAPTAGPVAESWELSDRDEGMSRVADGVHIGKSLRELLSEDRAALLGTSMAGAVFPLLIKVIDAAQSLSVQVHPDDESAPKVHGEAKSEAWYVLDARPGAFIYRGIQPGVTPEQFRKAVEAGGVEKLLVRHAVAAGDCIYIPGGTVHAIGAGCLLLEVQQNSNTTFRVYDWNRKDPSGKPRELHLEQAEQVMKFGDKEQHPPAEEGRCVTPYFSMEPITVGKRAVSASDPLKGFTVVFVEEGRVAFQHPGGESEAAAGTTWLIPAALRKCKIANKGSDPARVVIIRGVKGA